MFVIEKIIKKKMKKNLRKRQIRIMRTSLLKKLFSNVLGDVEIKKHASKHLMMKKVEKWLKTIVRKNSEYV